MPFTRSASSILGSGGDVVASDLTVDGTTVTVDETNNRLGVNTSTPQGTLGVDGDLYLQPTAISTSHIVGTGSIDMRADANIKIGTETADSVKIGRTNSGLVKCHIRSGGENDFVVSNSMVGIGTDTPDHTLSVAGDIDLTGALSFDGSAVAVDAIDTDLSSVAGTDTTLASAKAIKSYVDSVATSADLDATTDSGTIDIDLDSETLTVSGGEGINTSASGTTITIAAEESSASNKGAVIVAGGTDCTVTYSSGTATVAVDDLAASKLTSGTLADARVAASNVTQHQGSITGTGALNSGSITSGFTSIDVGSGAISTTGAVGTGPITTALSSATGILINQDYTDTDAATIVGLDIDFDKTGASTTNNNMYGVRVDMDNSSATNGTNLMVGASFTPTCVHAADAGSVTVKGVEIVATGGTPGTEIARGLEITSSGADFNQGIYCKVADGGPDLKMVSSADVGDYCTIAVGAAGATTVTTVDDDGASADINFAIDGSFAVTAATSVSFAADVTISGTTPQLTIGDGGEEDTLLVFDGHSGGADFRVGIDDSSDTLEIGKGSAHGTDAVIKVDSGANLVTLLNAAPADTKYSGTVVVLQAGEDLEIGEVVYLKPADGKVWKAVATASATSRAIAICTVDTAADAYSAFLIEGFLRADTNFPTYSAGDVLYTPESETSGKNCPENVAPDSAGDFVQIIGWAKDGNTVYVNFNSTVIGL